MLLFLVISALIAFVICLLQEHALTRVRINGSTALIYGLCALLSYMDFIHVDFRCPLSLAGWFLCGVLMELQYAYPKRVN